MTNISKKTILLVFGLLFLCTAGVFCSSDGGVIMKIWRGPDAVEDLIDKKLTLSLGNFGYVPWGKSITGIIYPADPIGACTPIEPIELDSEETSAPIVLIKRGGCTFVTKVANARAQGARMVIIVNDREEHVEFVEMVEDASGIGKSIDIPTVMISQKEGEKLENAVAEYYKALQKNKKSKSTNDNQPIVIHAKFPWNKKDKATVETWVSPGNPKSMDFLASFKEKEVKVLGASKFEPRHAVWRCESCKVEENWPNQEMANCLGGGRYCQPDPDDDGKLGGADMLRESLRQICIHKEADLDKYFKYIRYWNTTCVRERIFLKKEEPSLNTCYKDGLKSAEIDKDKIDSCVKKSWKGCNDEMCNNTLLESELDTFNKRAIAVWPAVIINSQTFKGNLLNDEVINSICMAFDDKSVPSSCSKFVVDPTKVNDNPDYYEGGNFWGTFFWVLFFLAIIMVIFFYYYRRFVRRAMVDEMNDQIQSAVATYFKMGDKAPNQA